MTVQGRLDDLPLDLSGCGIRQEHFDCEEVLFRQEYHLLAIGAQRRCGVDPP